MSVSKLYSDNPELLVYISGKLHITIPGGIRLTGLERLKVTLKISLKDRPSGIAFRHHLDLYNSIQTEQLIEKSAEVLDLSTSEISAVINLLCGALENYRSERLEAMKPKIIEKKKRTDRRRNQQYDCLSDLYFQKTAYPTTPDVPWSQRQWKDLASGKSIRADA